LDLSRSDVAAALTVLAVGTLPLVGVGILTSILSLLSPEKGEQMAFAVQGLLLLVSGVYYPVSVLPLPLQALGALSPMTYILEGMRSALLQGTHAGAMGARLALLAAMGVVLVPFALFCFGRAEHRARRLGLLKRSG
jgi:ABC-2 type transport system permease protein